MANQNTSPLVMTNMGKPSEISPIKDITFSRINPPMLEVTQPLKSREPIEIREPSSIPRI